nr:CinA family nicotinamide mononucleotide deamidase-related protein [Chitinophagaceae bacterium]
MNKVYATLITIGDELLIGQVIDTNSAWMAQELNTIGVSVRNRISVGDVWEDIWQALDRAAADSTLVLITGGLGPTADDITKPLLCSYFGGTMVVSEPVLNHVTQIFSRLNRPMIDRNRKQAEVPDVCTVLFNQHGTAPGMRFEKDGVIFISMPGVPHEMKGIMQTEVLPKLQTRLPLPALAHHTVLTAGVGESFLADTIQAWEEALPPHIKLAYLPNYGMVRLRLTAHGSSKAALQQEVAAHFKRLKPLIQEWLVTDRDEKIEEVLGRLLIEKGLTMATAESCTGGYMAHLITSLPGSSQWYMGSVVSYANGVKTTVLGVPATILETAGAVSAPVVEQMVRGVLAQTGAQVAVAVSGIMGPNGGTAEKPVGTVWVAVGNLSEVV